MKVINILGLTVIISLGTVKVQALPFSAIAQIAQPLTVEIVNNNSQGSGVIIDRQDKVYTILTAAHVVCGKNYQNCDRTAKYKIITNETEYSAGFNNVKLLPDRLDLAIVKFSSDRTYPVAKLGDSSQIKIGMAAYVAGFPAPTQAIEKSLFIAHEGKIVAVASGTRRINKNGYGTIYNTPTLPGMSGGGVFNDLGELIAIHGQGDRDADGTKTGNNLGIPIDSFVRLASKVGLNTTARVPSIASPKTADDYLISGVAKYYNGNKQSSVADLNRAIQLAPNKSALAYYQRGLIRSDIGVKQLALADFDRAIQIDPNYTKAYYRRGLIKAELADRSSALSDFDRAIAIDSTYLKPYLGRATLRAETKEYRGAIADYTIALRLDPKQASVYYQRGLARYNSGDKPAAIADFDRAIALNRLYAIAYYRRGVVRSELQDKQGARSDLQQAVKIFTKLGNQASVEEVNGVLDRLN